MVDLNIKLKPNDTTEFMTWGKPELGYENRKKYIKKALPEHCVRE